MKNWKTTLGGILLAIGQSGGIEGVPSRYQWIFGMLSCIGGLLLGMAAKDFDNHSTVQEVEQATSATAKKD